MLPEVTHIVLDELHERDKVPLAPPDSRGLSGFEAPVFPKPYVNP